MNNFSCPCDLREGKEININPTRLEKILHWRKKYYIGIGIRWLITNKKKKNVQCYHCGNIANGVVSGIYLRIPYEIPICKKHLAEFLNQ